MASPPTEGSFPQSSALVDFRSQGGNVNGAPLNVMTDNPFIRVQPGPPPPPPPGFPPQYEGFHPSMPSMAAMPPNEWQPAPPGNVRPAVPGDRPTEQVNFQQVLFLAKASDTLDIKNITPQSSMKSSHGPQSGWEPPRYLGTGDRADTNKSHDQPWGKIPHSMPVKDQRETDRQMGRDARNPPVRSFPASHTSNFTGPRPPVEPRRLLRDVPAEVIHRMLLQLYGEDVFLDDLINHWKTHPRMETSAVGTSSLPQHDFPSPPKPSSQNFPTTPPMNPQSRVTDPFPNFWRDNQQRLTETTQGNHGGPNERQGTPQLTNINVRRGSVNEGAEQFSTGGGGWPSSTRTMTYPRPSDAHGIIGASASEVSLHDLRISATRSSEDLRLANLASSTSSARQGGSEAIEPSSPRTPLQGVPSSDNIQWVAIPISADSLQSSHALVVPPALARSLLPSNTTTQTTQSSGGSPSDPNNRVQMPLHIPGADGARCNHFHNWKRLRSKRGFAYFVCYLCGAKWRTASNYREHGPSENSAFMQGGSAPSSPTISPSVTLDSLATAKTFESLNALRQNLMPMTERDDDPSGPAGSSTLGRDEPGTWDTKQGLFW